MPATMRKREQRRLMSSQSAEDSGDDTQLCKNYDEEHGICWRFYNSKTAKLASMLCLIVGYFLAELIVGHITNSLTLVADSFHMLSDALSLIVALVAVRMSRRTARDSFKPWLSKEPYFNTFGWVRFEVLGALINSTFLLALCISITLEAVEKFTEPELVDDPKLILGVGGGGLALNIFGLVIFGSHSHGHHHHGHSHGHSHDHSHSDSKHEDSDEEHSDKENVSQEQHLNMKAVFLHVLGDALGSVIVMASALVLWLLPVKEYPWTKYMDPSMSMILVFIMIFTTVPLFKQSSMILLQTVPKHIKLEAIRSKLQKIPGVQAIHDLHIWQLAGDKIVASVHVQCSNAEAYLKVVPSIKASLHDHGIHSFTVQPEFSFSDDEQSPFCQMVCGESCQTKTCCPRENTKSPNKGRSSVSCNGSGTKVTEQNTVTGPPKPPTAITVETEGGKAAVRESTVHRDVANSSAGAGTSSLTPERPSNSRNPGAVGQESYGLTPNTRFTSVTQFGSESQQVA